ncbi:MAG: response regulator [Candidatus Hydrogenedentes bacterium]|nr:response regulator [Candidatus Hydrogenedentota bacterium]
MQGESVLVVDDDPVNRMTIQQLIRRRNDFKILEAVDGKSALDFAQADPGLAAILLDVQMPDISGIEVCRLLKHNPRTRAVPIILISAVHTDDTSIAEGLEAGADGYLTKPVAENMLNAWLNAVTRINALNRALAENAGGAPGGQVELLADMAQLSHNINNPLQAIMATSDLLDLDYEADARVREAVRQIQDSAERIAQLVGQVSQRAKAVRQAGGQY